MSRLAWFDLASGVSGDMILSGLADAGERLGVDAAGRMSEAVTDLGLGCEVRFERVSSGGLSALRAIVDGGDRHVGVDGLMQALSGRPRALDALEMLVAAEADVHGVDAADVHLHELGQADTAVDLAGADAGFEALGIGTVAAAPVPLSSGWTRSAHGPLPLPGPAVLHLLRGVEVASDATGVETVTPTGIAILRARGAVFGGRPPMKLLATGTGAGTAELDRPNVCRVLVGEPVASDPDLEAVVLLEATVDDQTPESVGHALETLLAEGALDVWVTPVMMKRSRPGMVLSVLATPDTERALVRSVFRHTSTLGVRRAPLERWTIPREVVTVDVRGLKVRVKVAHLDGEVVTVSPELRDCTTVAETYGLGLDLVYAEARTAVLERLRT